MVPFRPGSALGSRAACLVAVEPGRRAARGAERNGVGSDGRDRLVADEPDGALKGAVGERITKGEKLVMRPAQSGGLLAPAVLDEPADAGLARRASPLTPGAIWPKHHSGPSPSSDRWLTIPPPLR